MCSVRKWGYVIFFIRGTIWRFSQYCWTLSNCMAVVLAMLICSILFIISFAFMTISRFCIALRYECTTWIIMWFQNKYKLKCSVLYFQWLFVGLFLECIDEPLANTANCRVWSCCVWWGSTIDFAAMTGHTIQPWCSPSYSLFTALTHSFVQPFVDFQVEFTCSITIALLVYTPFAFLLFSLTFTTLILWTSSFSWTYIVNDLSVLPWRHHV